jgi:hypothetical protein
MMPILGQVTNVDQNPVSLVSKRSVREPLNVTKLDIDSSGAPISRRTDSNGPG